MGYDGKRITVVNNGIDIEKLHPKVDLRNAFRRKWGIGSDEVLLGFVARFDNQKDHTNLFRGLSLLKLRGQNPTILLIGPGMETGNQTLMELIASEGLQSTVRPIGPQADIHAVMNALDLHVMSSKSEGFPNVLAEAMACGCPCVSTKVGAAEFIIGDTGWLVPPQNAEMLAKTLEDALRKVGGHEWVDRQKAARDRVTCFFSMDEMTQNYKNVWQL
jgi:glycosyltransferase involved in cell wall biosynthesis